MATFKACVQKIREDGTYLVYIRCTHNREITYIKTDMYIPAKKVIKNRIEDNDIIGKCAIKINDWLRKLNLEDTANWTVKEIIHFISLGSTKTPFISFCNKFIDNLINGGRDKSAKNYSNALSSFSKYFDKNITFQDLTSKNITSWIQTLIDTRRAKEMYPVAIRTMFDAGCYEYNDYDKNIIRISNQPFKAVKIPKAETPQKRAESPNNIKAILGVKPDTKRAIMAQDIAKLIIYLVGINTVDLFYMDMSCYNGNYIKYNRHKTMGERSDKAFIQIKVLDEIKPLFDKYKGKDKLFNWGYSDSQSFNKYVNMGLKRLCELSNIDKMTTYTFRHSWATIAQNKCGASTELVAFCLNHSSAHKVTEGYIEKDFTSIDKLNKKVLNYIFKNKK